MMSVITVTTMMALGGIEMFFPKNDNQNQNQNQDQDQDPNALAGASSNKPSRQSAAPVPAPGVAFLQSDSTSRENHKAWIEVKPEVRIQNYPPQYASDIREGFYDIKTANSKTTPKNAQVKYTCPTDGGECEVVVFVYDCSPCPGKKDGLQHYLMVEAGFERTRCAPTFNIMGSMVYHRMTAYVKSIAPDSIETIQIPNDTDFIAFGMSNAERPSCSSFGDQPSCDDTATRCIWKNNQCELRQCVQQGPYPAGGCNLNTCPLDMLLP